MCVLLVGQGSSATVNPGVQARDWAWYEVMKGMDYANFCMREAGGQVAACRRPTVFHCIKCIGRHAGDVLLLLLLPLREDKRRAEQDDSDDERPRKKGKPSAGGAGAPGAKRRR
jgi:hypothetical protein